MVNSNYTNLLSGVCEMFIMVMSFIIVGAIGCIISAEVSVD